jgi:2,3-bisphosphoglycerate-independent phosphoglycerate mutase
LPAPFTNDTRTRAPHDITDQSVLEDHPRGPGSDVLCDLMAASIGIFRDHPVNAARRNAG